MTTEFENVGILETEEHVDVAKREFMKKFGKYAATAPVGMYLLMGPGASKAQASGTTCSVSGQIGVARCGTATYTATGNSNLVTVNVDIDTFLYDDHWVIKKFGNGTYEVETGQLGTWTSSNMPAFMDDILDDLFTALGC